MILYFTSYSLTHINGNFSFLGEIMNYLLVTLLLFFGTDSWASQHSQSINDGMLVSKFETRTNPETKDEEPIEGHTYFIYMTVFTKQVTDNVNFLDSMVESFKLKDNAFWEKTYSSTSYYVGRTVDQNDSRIPYFTAEIVVEPKSSENIEAVEEYIEYLRGLTVEGFKIKPKKLKYLRVLRYLDIGNKHDLSGVGDGVVYIPTLREYYRYFRKEAQTFAINDDVLWNAQQLLDSFRLNAFKGTVLKMLSKATMFTFFRKLDGFIDDQNEMTFVTNEYWDDYFQMGCFKFKLDGYCYPEHL